MAEGPRGLGWRGLGLAALGVADALLLVWGGGDHGRTHRELTAVLAGAGFGGAALLWIALDRRFAQAQLGWVLGLALLLRAIATQATPLLEDDHYRYLWDGARTAVALDPYRLPPAAFFGAPHIAPALQDVLSGINHPELPTIYGPVLQALFGAAYLIAPARLEPLQGLLLVADMAVLGLLAHQRIGTRWLLAYAVHPLILKEAMASAHPDGLVALWLLLALAAWQGRRALWTGAWLGVALATKVAALVVLPLLLLAMPVQRSVPRWLWAAQAGAAMTVTVALLYLPFVLRGGSDAAALLVFGSEWRFNPLLFRAVELVGPAARQAAALLVAAGLGMLAWWWWQRAARAARVAPAEAATPLPPLDLAFMLLVLFSPVVNPWYWMWALALSLRLGRCGTTAIGVVSVASYAHVATPGASFVVAWPLALLQIGTLAAAWVVCKDRLLRHDLQR